MNDLSRTPEISVIIPVYNGFNTLSEQLDAFCQQTYDGNWELIVVDNGSTDQTVALVEGYQREIPQLQVIVAVERKGSAYARNEGVKVARADKLLFCDADDVICPEWIEELDKGLEQSDSVTGPLVWDEINELPFKWRTPSASDKIIQSALGFLPYAPGSNFGIHREVFQAIGGFSEVFRYQQDIEISWRLQLAGYKLLFLPNAIVHYRYRDLFRSSWKQLTNYAEAHVHLYKHYEEHGMPHARVKIALRRYKWLIWKFPKFVGVLLSTKHYPLQAQWVYKLALSWGRLRGVMKYQKIYL